MSCFHTRKVLWFRLGGGWFGFCLTEDEMNKTVSDFVGQSHLKKVENYFKSLNIKVQIRPTEIG